MSLVTALPAEAEEHLGQRMMQPATLAPNGCVPAEKCLDYRLYPWLPGLDSPVQHPVVTLSLDKFYVTGALRKQPHTCSLRNLFPLSKRWIHLVTPEWECLSRVTGLHPARIPHPL